MEKGARKVYSVLNFVHDSLPLLSNNFYCALYVQRFKLITLPFLKKDKGIRARVSCPRTEIAFMVKVGPKTPKE